MMETPAGEGGHYSSKSGRVCVVYVDRVVKAWIRRRVRPHSKTRWAGSSSTRSTSHWPPAKSRVAHGRTRRSHAASRNSDQVRTHRTSAVMSI